MKLSMFGTAGHWTVYQGRVTIGRFTVKRDAEKALRDAAKKAKA